MKGWGIRASVLAMALLPAIFIAVLLAAYFTYLRLNDLDRSVHERGLAIARQLAPASEYGLFSGNDELLKRLADAALREADVVGVTISDAAGKVHARSRRENEGEASMLFRAPVNQSQVAVEDYFYPDAQSVAGILSRPKAIGEIAVDLSRSSTLRRQQQQLLLSLLLGAGCLLVATALALRMSRAVILPVKRLADALGKIGEGKLETRVQESASGELGQLEHGINTMANKLMVSQQGLRDDVALATHELREQKQIAEAANVAKSHFLAAASHDLRQPMHALGLFVGALKDRTLDPKLRDIVDKIDASVMSMDVLMNSILDISRLDAGVLVPQMQSFPINDVFRNVHRVMAPKALENGLSLRMVPSRRFIHSDPAMVERIVINLVSNAIRYTYQGGVVMGCRYQNENTLRIEVWDSGIGIPAEQQSRIFEEFYQLHNTQRDRENGLGLGLAIVDRISKLLDTHVTLRSRLGEGSTFSFSLPLGTPQAEPIEKAELFSVQQMNGCVVVVDDEKNILNAMSALLGGWGLDVIVASSLESAVRQLKAHPAVPGIIISDYRLPGDTNGIDVIRNLRALFAGQAPGILLTGDTAPERLREAQASGYALLHKPLEPARLRALLTHLLRDAPEGKS